MSRIVLNHPLFDGEKVIEHASVTIEDGRITQITQSEQTDNRYFLMPGLMDAHTHMTNQEQVRKMLKSGIVATCDVCATSTLISSAKPFEIISSAEMAMGVVLNPKSFVRRCVDEQARYIKVLLFNTLSVGKTALRGIVKAAHEENRKVAVHATELATMKQAVDAGADILIHVPMKEELPKELAMTIAQKGMAVVPTLVMMETFAMGAHNGYKPEHYQNAENAVRMLHECKVPLLSGTDANIGSFAPAVSYGSSMHREMQLLVQAGLTPSEVLMSATSKVAECFEIEEQGMVSVGKKANLLLVEGRPDRDMNDIKKTKQVWINGETIL